MSDTDLLMDTADRLLVSVVAGTRGLWPRTVALAVRSALELELDAFWSRVQPEVRSSPRRSQLLLLPSYAGERTARDAAEAWYGLSRASHHHAYELAPTAGELRGWHTQVEGVRRSLTTAELDPRDQA